MGLDIGYRSVQHWGSATLSNDCIHLVPAGEPQNSRFSLTRVFFGITRQGFSHRHRNSPLLLFVGDRNIWTEAVKQCLLSNTTHAVTFNPTPFPKFPVNYILITEMSWFVHQKLFSDWVVSCAINCLPVVWRACTRLASRDRDWWCHNGSLTVKAFHQNFIAKI